MSYSRSGSKGLRPRREDGLAAAIEAAGGVVRLAGALGLSQPTVSAWTRIPAHHVIAVEAFTRIDRRRLRPDLYDVPELQSRFIVSGHVVLPTEP